MYQINANKKVHNPYHKETYTNNSEKQTQLQITISKQNP